MKIKLMTILAGVLMPVFILLMAYEMAVAAPTGELTIVSPYIGNEIPLPWGERAQANDWMKLLYDPLVGTTPDTEVSAGAGLAERWEMSSDGLIWTFYLKKGIKFHDGVEVTAKDVKFTLEKDMGRDSKTHVAGSLRDTIKSMEIKDTYILVVHCKKPSLFLPDGLLSDIGASAGMITPKDHFERVGYDQFVKNPIGSGPYKWHSHMVGSYIKLEAIDRHWRDGVPKYKYVTFRIIPEESTRVAMLKTGEADIARISRESVKECLDAGLNVITKKNAAIVQFQPNFQYDSPTLSDIRFRKALTNQSKIV